MDKSKVFLAIFLCVLVDSKSFSVKQLINQAKKPLEKKSVDIKEFYLKKRFALKKGNSYAISKCAKLFAFASLDNKKIHIFDGEKKKIVSTYDTHTTFYKYITFGPYSKYLVTSDKSGNCCVTLFNLKNKKDIVLYEKLDKALQFKEFMPDGKNLLLCNKNKKLVLYDIARKNCKPFSYEYGKDAKEVKIDVSADGRYIVSGSQEEKSVIVYDMYHEKEFAKYSFCEKDLSCLCISTDGAYVAMGFSDGEVVLFNVKSNSVYATHTLHKYPVGAICFSTGCKYLVSTTESDGNEHEYSVTYDVKKKKEYAKVPIPRVWGLKSGPGDRYIFYYFWKPSLGMVGFYDIVAKQFDYTHIDRCGGFTKQTVLSKKYKELKTLSVKGKVSIYKTSVDFLCAQKMYEFSKKMNIFNSNLKKLKDKKKYIDLKIIC